MVDVLPLLAAVGVIVLWCLGLYGLQRRGLLEPHGLQPSPPPAGPLLMWETGRRRQPLDRLAPPKRVWRGLRRPPGPPRGRAGSPPAGPSPGGGAPRPDGPPP